MRVLFNVWPRFGHLNPSIAIAAALRERGHEVALVSGYGSERIQLRLAEVGLDLPVQPWPTARPNPPSRGLALTRRLADPAWRTKYFERMFLHHELENIPALRKVIREYQPDILCSEAVSIAGAVAAVLENIPWVSLASTWDFAFTGAERTPFNDFIASIAPVRDKLVQAAGARLQFHGSQVVSPMLNLIAGLEELTPIRPNAPPNTHAIGFVRLPSVAPIPFPWDKIGAAPLIYVSGGTEFFFEPAVTRDVAEAALLNGAQVVLASADRESWVEGEHVLNVLRAPQTEVLERAAICVTSGGANTAAECILAGVPMLIIPLGFDQPANAQRLAKAGVALVLEPSEVSADALAMHFKALAEGAPERKSIERWSRLAGRTDAGRRGAEMLTALINEL